MPNPTTPVDVAEGRRLLAVVAAKRAAATGGTNTPEWEAFQKAREDYNDWLVDNGSALLRAASERDAAVREVERLREALKFYSEGFIPRPAKRNKYGLNPGLEWKPSEALLDDCGNVAMEALASAAQGGANG